jgi:hypothetical protein
VLMGEPKQRCCGLSLSGVEESSLVEESAGGDPPAGSLPIN